MSDFRKEQYKRMKKTFDRETALANPRPCPRCPEKRDRQVGPNGYYAFCSECLAEIKEEKYPRYKEKIAQYNKKVYTENQDANRIKAKKRSRGMRRTVLCHYSGADIPFCSCCGESHYEFLTMDHIDGKGNEHRKEIGKRYLYEWLIKNNFPEGFRVLCWNCNASRGHYGFCPHEFYQSFLQ